MMPYEFPENVSYDIEPELLVREILEQNTSHKTEFWRSKNQYQQVDLKCRYWKGTTERYYSWRDGYVEVETSKCWDTKKPSESYDEYRFMKRKFFKEYDKDTHCWGQKIEDLKRTIYLKSNRSFTNMIAVPMEVILRDGEEDVKNNGGYNQCYYVLPLEHENVAVGIEDVSKKIEGFVSRLSSK